MVTLNNSTLNIQNTTTTINRVNYQFPTAQPGTNTTPIIRDGQGTIAFVPMWERVASTSLAAATATSTSGNVPARKAYRGNIHIALTPVKLR